MTEQDRRSRVPHSRSIPEVDEGGLSDGGNVHPPKSIEMEESGGIDTIHVAAQGDNDGAGMEDYPLHHKSKTNIHGVFSLETLWKMVGAIIDTRLNVCIASMISFIDSVRE